VVDGGRTELICVFCDRLDPMEIELTNKWAESPLAILTSEPVPSTNCARAQHAYGQAACSFRTQ
jgi:hypothetical protein